jgi:hypothetical protein
MPSIFINTHDDFRLNKLKEANQIDSQDVSLFESVSWNSIFFKSGASLKAPINNFLKKKREN